ncbi:uncharacterized protein N7518_004281 [Penicillium psychrosexuale]|uniref:uncharacterized protein n=1 Tax=Penicillium psychrosexuale TaxID=1002107 RepID=UPI0025452FC0|nr:uncharacterized protein N7518_004281 [Penicillium psychrosexuale]KAJ5795741.1 hypothetical protein N7518_004281 [Penicillium psychrosexuale]
MWSIRCIPDIQVDRESYYLKGMMSANAQTDIILETRNSPYLEAHLWLQFGLQSPMGDVNLEWGYGLRKHKEARSWEVRVQSKKVQNGDGYPPPGDDEQDL